MSTCSKCGNCCVNFSVPGVTTQNVRSFLSSHDFLEIVSYGERGHTFVPRFICHRLVDTDNGQRVYRDYENRPDFCKNYPGQGQRRAEKCTM